MRSDPLAVDDPPGLFSNWTLLPWRRKSDALVDAPPYSVPQAVRVPGCRALRRLPTKVVMLDVDGVLHPLIGQPRFQEGNMRELGRIVNETGARIVLSSTWRLLPRTTRTVNRKLEDAGLAPIVGKTPCRLDFWQRHKEIVDWLRENPYVQRWVALDDHALSLPSTHFIQTNGMVGLTSREADRAISLLNGWTRPVPPPEIFAHIGLRQRVSGLLPKPFR
mmetsp:Transcript_19686/g.56440  ORF Transcript_19686/g.56440 Transcript_19686/m.56440 type:complete len:220 (-) Transcript_19686:806-1465(-)